MNLFEKISLRSILYLLLILYPIMPTNKYIGPLSMANIISLAICCVYFAQTEDINLYVFTYNPFFWLFPIVYAIFCLFSGSMVSAISWVVNTIFVAFVITQLVTTEKEFYRLLDTFAVSSFLMSILGIFESLSGRYLIQGALYADWSDRFRYGLLRCSGPFGHPINFAFFQAIVALILFYRIQNHEVQGMKQKLYVVVYGLAVISMFLAVSRLPLCFFVAAQGILILKLSARKVTTYAIVIFFAAIGGVFVLEKMGVNVIQIIYDLTLSILKMLGIQSNLDYSSVKGFGNRFDLYSWVHEAIGEHYLFGRGMKAIFEHRIGKQFIKTSIEVHYLYIYFKCGLVGLFFLLLSYAGNLTFFIRRFRWHLSSEKSISFVFLLCLIFTLYYICLFGVQETDITRLYFELVALGIANLRIIMIERSKR